MKNILIHENSMCPKCQSTNYKVLKSATHSREVYKIIDEISSILRQKQDLKVIV